MRNRPSTRWIYAAPMVAFGFFAMVLLAVGGCASLEHTLKTDSRVQYSGWLLSRQAVRLQQKQHWHWQGRAAVVSVGKVKRVSIDWLENKSTLRLVLSGPVGIGRVSIVADSMGVTLVKGKDRIKAESIDALLSRYFDWPLLSIDQLRGWLWGMADNAQYSQFFSNGYLQQLSVNGWMLEYDDYQTVNGVALPYKLRAKKGSAMIKLKITRWQLF